MGKGQRKARRRRAKGCRKGSGGVGVRGGGGDGELGVTSGSMRTGNGAVCDDEGRGRVKEEGKNVKGLLGG